MRRSWMSAAVVVAFVASAAMAAGAPVVGADVKAALGKINAGDGAGGRQDLARLSAAGHLDAEQALGEVLFFGLGGPPDPKAACAHFERSSAQWSTGMHDLALCAEQGLVTGSPDLPKAAELYRKAADMGEAKAKCALGNLLISGRGVPQDQVRGHALCLEAAQAGVADSQADVGNQFLMGVGVAKDVAAARHWYELATAQGQRNAAYTLAEIYWNADGVARDLDKCEAYWRIALAGGRKDAALRLGDVEYLRAGRGKDVWDPAGLAKARDWYDQASQVDNPAVRAQAVDRRDLSERLRQIMLKRQSKG